MITWAALLVLQGVEGGVGEPEGKSKLPFLPSHSLPPSFHERPPDLGQV